MKNDFLNNVMTKTMSKPSGKIKGWYKQKDTQHSIVYYTSLKNEGVGGLPKQTVQVFGNRYGGNLHIMKSVPAPTKGYFINKFIVKRDNLEGNQFKNIKEALTHATNYMRSH